MCSKEKNIASFFLFQFIHLEGGPVGRLDQRQACINILVPTLTSDTLHQEVFWWPLWVS